MPASYKISESVRSILVAMGVVPSADPVPGLAGWRRSAQAR